MADQLRPRIRAQMGGGGGVSGGLNQFGAQTNFEDLTLFLTYGPPGPTHPAGFWINIQRRREQFFFHLTTSV